MNKNLIEKSSVAACKKLNLPWSAFEIFPGSRNQILIHFRSENDEMFEVSFDDSSRLLTLDDYSRLIEERLPTAVKLSA